MRPTRLLCLALIASVGAGCSDEGSSSSSETIDASDVQKETSEAVSAMGDYASQKKDEIVNTLEKKYEQMKPRIDEYIAKAKAAKADANVAVSDAVDDLQARQNDFEKRLASLRDASGDAWKNVSEGASDAWGELEKAFERAKKEFEGASSSPSN